MASLESSIRTCKIDTAYAPKVFSDRFLNPCNTVCPMWSGYDSVGRSVCPNSYKAKSAGCQSAMDRVRVETHQRPQYGGYVFTNSVGVNGGATMDNCEINQGVSRERALCDINEISGNFGAQFGANVYPGCGVNRYKRAMES